jgi:hypothetical protein
MYWKSAMKLVCVPACLYRLNYPSVGTNALLIFYPACILLVPGHHPWLHWGHMLNTTNACPKQWLELVVALVHDPFISPTPCMHAQWLSTCCKITICVHRCCDLQFMTHGYAMQMHVSVECRYYSLFTLCSSLPKIPTLPPWQIMITKETKIAR